MGLLSRTKGKTFERKIARMFRERWPDAVVRRASQAERADNPDVFIEGGPPMLSLLWMELQDARNPTPIAKLEQAENYVENWNTRRMIIGPGDRMPVVVWHRLGERTISVTFRTETLDQLRGIRGWQFGDGVPVTMSLDHFLYLLPSEPIP